MGHGIYPPEFFEVEEVAVSSDYEFGPAGQSGFEDGVIESITADPAETEVMLPGVLGLRCLFQKQHRFPYLRCGKSPRPRAGSAWPDHSNSY